MTAATMTALLAVPVIDGAGAAGASPATEPVRYVALGDSYSAGSGVEPVDPNSPSNCLRSSNNYAALIAREQGYDFTDVSCGGATTEHFFTSQYPGVKPQLDALGPETDLVTFTIGGNDGMVFALTVGKCLGASALALGQGSPCKVAFGGSIEHQIRTETRPNLVRAMKAIRAKAPRARVAVLSYPLIVPARYEPCQAFPAAAGDFGYTYGIQAALNDAIRGAARETGVTYIDATTPSEGHDSCKPVGVRWVEPVLSAEQFVPVHPNELGEQKMAEIATRALSLD